MWLYQNHFIEEQLIAMIFKTPHLFLNIIVNACTKSFLLNCGPFASPSLPILLKLQKKKIACVKFPAKTAVMTPFTSVCVWDLQADWDWQGSYFQLARIESLMSLLIRLLLVCAALCFILAFRRNESTALGLNSQDVILRNKMRKGVTWSVL